MPIRTIFACSHWTLLVPLAAGLLNPALAQRSSQSPLAASTGAYYALVIGINQYHPPLPNLKTAVSDAETVARILTERYGFQVKLLLDGKATRPNILDSLDQFSRSLHENDSLLIYYAGHGHADPRADKAYWLPADAGETPSNWIIADELTTDIRVQPARHVLVISDSCYSGGLTRGVTLTPRSDDQTTFLTKMLAGKSRTLMSSGGDEPVADGGEGGHSVFAGAVIRALQQEGAAQFTAAELFQNFVLQQVAGRSNQIPQYAFLRDSDHDTGDFVFTRRGTSGGGIPTGKPAPEKAAPAPEPRTQPETVWEELKSAPPNIKAMIKHGSSIVVADGTAHVYRTVDAGAHWTSQAVSDPKATVVRLASCGSTLLAGVNGEGRPSETAVFLSEDNGVTWRPTALQGNRVSALGCSGATILAGMWPRTQRDPGGGFRALNMKGDAVGDVVYPTLVLSKDGGNTWEISRKRFDARSFDMTGNRFEVFGRDSSVPGGSAFVMNHCYNTGGWVCSSVFSKFRNVLPLALQRVGDVLIVGTQAGTVMLSVNGGKSWKESPLPLPEDTESNGALKRAYASPTQVNAITVVNRQVLLGTLDKGLLASDAQAETWSKIGGRPLTGLQYLEYDGTFLFAATEDGLFRTRLLLPQ